MSENKIDTRGCPKCDNGVIGPDSDVTIKWYGELFCMRCEHEWMDYSYDADLIISCQVDLPNIASFSTTILGATLSHLKTVQRLEELAQYDLSLKLVKRHGPAGGNALCEVRGKYINVEKWMRESYLKDDPTEWEELYKDTVVTMGLSKKAAFAINFKLPPVPTPEQFEEWLDERFPTTDSRARAAAKERVRLDKYPKLPHQLVAPTAVPCVCGYTVCICG